MLDKEKAVKVIRKKRSDSPNGFRTYYIFKCAIDSCGKELSVREPNLKKSTGLCYEHRSILARKRPYEKLYNTLVYKAKLRKLTISLTYDEYVTLITQNTRCHYCWIHIPMLQYSKSYNYYIDRMNPNTGYELNNCVVCCSECNFLKSDKFSYIEFCVISEGIKKVRRMRGQN